MIAAKLKKLIADQNKITLAIGRRKDLTLKEKVKALKGRYRDIDTAVTDYYKWPSRYMLEISELELTDEHIACKRGKVHPFYYLYHYSEKNVRKELYRNTKEKITPEEEDVRRWRIAKSGDFDEHLKKLGDLKRSIRRIKEESSWWHSKAPLNEANKNLDDYLDEWNESVPVWDRPGVIDLYKKHTKNADTLGRLNDFLNSGAGKSMTDTVKKELVKITESIEYVVQKAGKSVKGLPGELEGVIRRSKY